MKKIVKTEGILFVDRLYKNIENNPKNPTWASVSYHVGSKTMTSKNLIKVRFDAKTGDRISIYYIEGKPKKVYKYAWIARMIG